MKLYRRFNPTFFPWISDNNWQLCCHCVDKQAAKSYIDSARMSSGLAYEYGTLEDGQQEIEEWT